MSRGTKAGGTATNSAPAPETGTERGLKWDQVGRETLNTVSTKSKEINHGN